MMTKICREFRAETYIQGMDFYNNANAWLQDFVGPVIDTLSGSEANGIGDVAEFSKWAKCLLFSMRLRGERTALVDDASFCSNASGEGWKSSYMSGRIDGRASSEVIIVIDNEVQAVQFSLTDL
jgi:hypothetical protein